MTDHSNVYAVARIRVLENTLFTKNMIDQLMACKTCEDCLNFLTERGWGASDKKLDAQDMLRIEREKTWNVIRDMQVDMSEFDVLSYQNLYHNLKAAIKEVCVGASAVNVYYKGTSVSKEEMLRIVKEKDFESLPSHMRKAAAEALKVMLQTKDGQLCDIIIDHALLDAVRREGENSKNNMIKSYAETFVSSADIKIAVRAAKTGKNKSFLNRALAKCDSLNVEKLLQASLSGFDAVCEYLLEAGFAV
jgi:V/A-type H+-transporting ATPase subunit C